MRDVPKPTGWTHVVLNYIGPNNGQGIQVYHGGEPAGRGDTKSGLKHSPGDGRVVLGRVFTDSNSYYASVDVDEISFFNKALTGGDIRYIKNMA